MRSRSTTLSALILLYLAAPAVLAETEISAFGGYRFGGSFDVADSDDVYDVNDASSFGFAINHDYRPDTQWEVFFSRQSTRAEFDGTTISDPVVDIDITTLELGGTYLWEGETLQPYLAATLGGTHVGTDSVGKENDTFWSGSIGLGVRVFPKKRVGLRLELRAHGVFTDEDSDVFCRTGPEQNVCAIKVEGNLLRQIEAFAGVTVRF